MSKKRNKKIPKPKLTQKQETTAEPICEIPKLEDKKLIFSFHYFDREHPLFNIGNVEQEWYLELFDCLHEVSKLKFTDLFGTTYDLHEAAKERVNTKPPLIIEQSKGKIELYQFRLDKSSGRVFGIYYDGIFYVIWLDKHHNYQDSPGYGKAKYYPKPKTTYERLKEKFENLKCENDQLRIDLAVYQITCDECRYKLAAVN